jgi:hypothetical protein
MCFNGFLRDGSCQEYSDKLMIDAVYCAWFRRTLSLTFVDFKKDFKLIIYIAMVKWWVYIVDLLIALFLETCHNIHSEQANLSIDVSK